MSIEREKKDYRDGGKDRKKGYIKSALSLLKLYILLFLLSACGSDGNISSGTTTSIPSSETGSIHFNIEWQSTPISTSNSSILTGLALDCAASGVSIVEAKVYDETNSLLASGEWSCAAHSGTINDVKAGSNRTLVILGRDSLAGILNADGGLRSGGASGFRGRGAFHGSHADGNGAHEHRGRPGDATASRFVPQSQ